jgi:predicted amidophosphoribosyltransferase
VAANAPEPAGFGNCRECAYVGTGTASICFGCASETIEEVALQRCMTCDGHLTERGRCGNPLCNDSPVSRGWDYIYAVAMRSGHLKETIERYKYGNHKGWAGIFGRVLVGYLEEGMRAEDWDLIVPMPTYVGDGGRSWDHIDLIVEHASIEGPDLPFVRGVMGKTKATPRLVAQAGFRARAEVAEQYFGPALEVVNPAAVAEKSVLVFDDVFTSGLTLREVAHKLKRAGAKDIAGVVLARQPFGS